MNSNPDILTSVFGYDEQDVEFEDDGPDSDFDPSEEFTGSREGFIFTTASKGTGYYRDAWQRTKKLVVVKKDASVTKEDLIAHCRQNLTGYKIPSFVEFRDDLPKTPVGKILRRELRDKPKETA